MDPTRDGVSRPALRDSTAGTDARLCIDRAKRGGPRGAPSACDRPAWIAGRLPAVPLGWRLETGPWRRNPAVLDAADWIERRLASADATDDAVRALTARVERARRAIDDALRARDRRHDPHAYERALRAYAHAAGPPSARGVHDDAALPDWASLGLPAPSAGPEGTVPAEPLSEDDRRSLVATAHARLDERWARSVAMAEACADRARRTAAVASENLLAMLSADPSLLEV